MKKCRSQSRCGQIMCAVCARRYAGHMAKRIASDSIGRLYAAEIELTPSAPADFWRWRTEVRNLIDYRRRENRWWRFFLLQVWLCHDGKLRGIVSLGSLSEAEVLTAFNQRWPTTLQPIEASNLRREIAAIVHPSMITPVQVRARYQTVKLTICPQQTKIKVATSPVPEPLRTRIEPMPILF
jgi:hypothetical protein